MLRGRSHTFWWTRGLRLLPVILALLAIALSSLHAGEVHAETGQSQTILVQQIEIDAGRADLPAEKPATHCTLNIACHAPGLLAATTSVLGDMATFDVVWPETLFFHDGRTLTVPTPPPLAARA